MTSFADLGLRAELVAALVAEGINEPFPIQEETIRDSLAGRDVCGRAKTGSGKTLAFGLVMISRLAGATSKPGRPRGLVLVPTRELAAQVTGVLAPLARSLGVQVAAVYGGADRNAQIVELEGGVDPVAVPRTPTQLDRVGAVDGGHARPKVNPHAGPANN